MVNNSSKLFFIIGLWVLTLQNFGIKGDYWGRPMKKDETTTDVFNEAVEAENAGDYDKATKLYMKLAHIFETLQGPENPDSIKMFINLQRVYFNTQKFQKALPLGWKIYKLQEKLLGKEHPDTVDTLTQLGKTYLMQEKHQKAEELLKRAYRLTKAQLGGNHPETIEILSALAQIYRDSREPKQYEVALRYYKKIYDVRANDPDFGEEHKKTVEALRNIGNVLALQNKPLEAVKIFEKVLEILTRKMGEDHPLTKEVRHALFFTLTHTGKIGQAQAFLENPSQIKDMDDETLFKVVQGKITALGEKRKYAQALEILTEMYEHEILKPHLPPRILLILEKLISFSRLQNDMDQMLKWARVMIDLAQRQRQNHNQNQQKTQKIHDMTDKDDFNLILIHLHALEAAIYVHAQKNDEDKVDEYFLAVGQVYKGQIQGQVQGQQRWVILREKYFRIPRVVADFKTKIGKTEKAKVLFEYLAQNAHEDLKIKDQQKKIEL